MEIDCPEKACSSNMRWYKRVVSDLQLLVDTCKWPLNVADSSDEPACVTQHHKWSNVDFLQGCLQSGLFSDLSCLKLIGVDDGAYNDMSSK